MAEYRSIFTNGHRFVGTWDSAHEARTWALKYADVAGTDLATCQPTAGIVHYGVTDTRAYCDAPIDWDTDATSVNRDVTCPDCRRNLWEG